MKTLYKPSFILFFSLVLIQFAYAQHTVSGVVRDKGSGAPLIGVTVALTESTRGVISDVEGRYTIEVPTENSQLRFSYFGYIEQTIMVSTAKYVEVALISVQEVTIPTSNGGCISIPPQPHITTAITTLKKFNSGNITNPVQLAQGRMAGLSITRPGSDPNGDFIIRVRGLSSIESETAPLIVLDGVPGVDMQLIDPSDIESITVLKDAASAAIYGMRGAAGVLLITSKKGTNGSKVAYNSQISLDQAARTYTLLNAEKFIGYGGADLSPNENIDTDWQSEVLRTGISHAHNLSLSGDVGRGTYRTSFNFRDVQGILRGSGLRQYNGSVAFSQKALSDRLTIHANLSANLRDAAFGFIEAYRYALTANPSMAVRSADPEYERYGGYVQKDLFDYYNPTAISAQNKNDGKVTNLLGNLHADFEVLPGLVAGLQLAQARSNRNFGGYSSKQSRYGGGYDRNGYARQSQQQRSNNLLQLTGNYQHNFNGLKINILGGYAWQQYYNTNLQVEAGDILTDEFENHNLGAFLDITRGKATISSYTNQNTLIAFFGRAQVNYNDRYFLEFGMRREGSSRLSKDHQWGQFPFISAGVDLTKFLTVNNLQQLKFRVGYGIAGQQPNESGLSKAVFRQGALFYYNGSFNPSYGLARNANPDLKWEEKHELNIGLDFTLNKGRITGSIDWFKQRSFDLITASSVSVPPNIATTTYQNTAEIKNSGVEINLNWNDLIKSEHFSWSLGAAITANNLILSDIGRKDSIIYSSFPFPGGGSAFYSIIYPGSRLGELWGPVRQSLGPDGQIIYKDIDKNGQINSDNYNRDQTFLGSGLPAFEFGLNSNIKFRNFDLNFLLRGAVGHEIAHENRILYENLNTTFRTWNKVVTKYFDEKIKPFSNRLDDYYVEKGSFLRLDNVTLGYNLHLKTTRWLSNMRIYVGGQNLLTLTNYTGLDPEVRYIDNFNAISPLSPGIDRSRTYPLARTVLMGVNFGF